MISDTDVVVYSAEQQSRSLIGSIQVAWQDVRRGRHVLRHIFIRDFVSQFRQRLLGYFWAVLTPMMGAASFLFMFLIGVLRPGVADIPYPLFLFVGITLWSIAITALQAVSSSLVAQSDLMLRTNVPPIVIAFSAVASLLYANLINIVSVFLLSFAMGVVPSPWSLLFPILIAPLFLLGVGGGLLLAVLSASARDINSIVLTILSFVMFLSPVYFSTNFAKPALRLIALVNPFTYLINVPRDMFYLGHSNYWGGYLIISGVSVLLFVVGIHGFYLIKDKVAERL